MAKKPKAYPPLKVIEHFHDELTPEQKEKARQVIIRKLYNIEVKHLY